MIYYIHMIGNRIAAFKLGGVAAGSPSFRATIDARSGSEAIFLYVSELERRSKEQPTLLSLTQKLAERNAYLEQAIRDLVNHNQAPVVVIDYMKATIDVNKQ